MVDPDGRLVKVIIVAGGDIREYLRIPVYQREPAALYLHHDPVAFFECMVNFIELEFDLGSFSRHKRLRLLIAVPEFTAEYFGTDHALESHHILPPGIIGRLVIVAGKNVNDFDHHIGVSSAGGKKKVCVYAPR